MDRQIRNIGFVSLTSLNRMGLRVRCILLLLTQIGFTDPKSLTIVPDSWQNL